MRIKKETFIEDFIEVAIVNYDSFNSTGCGKSMSEYMALGKLGDKASDKLKKMSKFLSKDPTFAKETLDKLVEISDKKGAHPAIMSNVATELWQFNYRLEDFHRLETRAHKIMKGTFALYGAEAIYKNILAGRLQRPKDYPKLD